MTRSQETLRGGRVLAFDGFSDDICSSFLSRGDHQTGGSLLKTETDQPTLSHRAPMIAARLSVVLLAGFLSGCATLQPGSRPSDPLAALRYDIEKVLADSIFIPSQASVKIVSLDSKEVLFDHNSRLLVRPASNMKLLTSSTALSVLGLDHKFRTAVLADSISGDNSHCTNLFLKGYGDPDLVSADLDSLALLVRQHGVKSVTGGVIADVSYYDDVYWGYGWNWDDEPYSYAAFISPLSVNDNCVSVTVSPGDTSGKAVAVSINPASSYVTVLNKAITVSDTVLHPLVVSRLFREHLNIVVVEGEMKQGSQTVERQISVRKPELYAATLFQEALQRRGIFVGRQPAVGTAPQGARELASYSRNFAPVLVNLNKVSDNLSAEMMLKTMSAVTDKAPGSAQGGVYAIHRFLSTFGIDTTKYQLADGSGLSFYDLISAEMIIQLLQGMAQQKELFPTFLESLPIAGVDGTISSRMRQTPAQGNLRAKTGTINGVSSLSGYVQTLDGEKLAFAMTMQNFTLPTRLYQRAQDKIGALLASFSRLGRTSASRP